MLVVHHDLQTAKEYFDWMLLLNMRKIAFGPTEHVFTIENLQNVRRKACILKDHLLKGNGLMALHHIWLQLQEPNTQWVLAGTLLLGMASGVLGSFVLLRRQSLIGDAMAHSALPGVCLAFLIAGEKTMLFFLIGAAAAGLLELGASRTSRSIQNEGGFCDRHRIVRVFGIGIILLTYIQRLGSGSQSGLDSFIRSGGVTR